jgi:endonuclease/exonuclease/phosphatase family metal-dependent hydrolase
MPAPEQIVIASYNVHRCVGGDGRLDPDRVAAVLAELSADVVGLQEVSRSLGAEGVDQLAYLAREAGFAWLRGPTLIGDKELYGNGLLTRLPLRNARLLDLSQPGREPRGAIDADLTVDSTPLRVVVTHLGLGVRERRRQCARLLAQLERRDDAPCVLLGDFNEWWMGPRLFARFRRMFGATRRLRTFPARAPLLALDRIWVWPPDIVKKLHAHRSTLARWASDHLPVRAVISVPPPRPLLEPHS